MITKQHRIRMQVTLHLDALLTDIDGITLDVKHEPVEIVSVPVFDPEMGNDDTLGLFWSRSDLAYLVLNTGLRTARRDLAESPGALKLEEP